MKLDSTIPLARSCPSRLSVRGLFLSDRLTLRGPGTVGHAAGSLVQPKRKQLCMPTISDAYDRRLWHDRGRQGDCRPVLEQPSFQGPGGRQAVCQARSYLYLRANPGPSLAQRGVRASSLLAIRGRRVVFDDGTCSTRRRPVQGLRAY